MLDLVYYKMKKIFAILCILCSLGIVAQQKMLDKPRNILPELTENVNDAEKLMTAAQQQELTGFVKGVGKAKVIVFTSPDAGFYETFADYLSDICIKNHFDAPGHDYVLIAVSKNLMEIRILCSKELQDRLSQTALQNIIDNEMIPDFMEDRYFEGIVKAVSTTQKLL